jgi:dolichyl-phosphate beta-glucosyltransferase
MEAQPRISIVIPAYDAAGFIGESLRRVRDFLAAGGPDWAPWEILVVDDGSRDETSARAREALPDATVLRHERNRGKGAAVRTGMLAARGRFRFFVDADVPFDLEALRQMLRYLDLKEYDVTIGQRRIEDLVDAGVRPGPARRLASQIFTQLVSRIVVTGVRDTQCGMKGFRADAAETLFRDSRLEGFAFDVEVLYYAFKRDLDVKRVAVRITSSGSSSVSLVRHGAAMLWDVIGIPFRFHFGGGARRLAPGVRERRA